MVSAPTAATVAVVAQQIVFAPVAVNLVLLAIAAARAFHTFVLNHLPTAHAAKLVKSVVVLLSKCESATHWCLVRQLPLLSERHWRFALPLTL